MPERIPTGIDIFSVWTAILARLQSQLGLNESTCFWWLDDGDNPPPAASELFVTVQPDGGDFDGAMFMGGGTHQATVKTNVLVTVHTTSRLDTPGRDVQFLLGLNGVASMLNRVMRALSGYDPTFTGFVFGPAKITAITGATNAAPIVVTAAAHGLTSGDTVIVSGVGGNYAANGSWTITVLTANTFSLTGSDGSVATNGNQAYAAAPVLRGQISPTGFQKPWRSRTDNRGSVTVGFEVSFDWALV